MNVVLGRDSSTEEFFFETIKGYYGEIKDPRQKAGDVRIMCSNGSIYAHQCILSQHSPFLKDIFLSRQRLEFGIDNWHQGLVYLLDRRLDDDEITLYCPGVTTQEIRLVLSLLYKGEVSIEGHSVIESLNSVCKFLGISTFKISDLTLIESPKNRKRHRTSSLSEERNEVIIPQIRKKKNLVKKHDDKNKIKNKNLGSVEPAANYGKHDCEVCGETIVFNVRKNFKGNYHRYIAHLLRQEHSKFRDDFFYDVPENLHYYYCSKCNASSISRVSFISHISMEHDEFYSRLERRLSQVMNLLEKEDNEALEKEARSLNKIKRFLLSSNFFPRRLFGSARVSSSDEILDAFEKNHMKESSILCSKCVQYFKSEEKAIRHFCTVHCRIELEKVDGIFKCNSCEYKNYYDWRVLCHMGIEHQLFKELDLKRNLRGLQLAYSTHDESTSLPSGESHQYICYVCSPPTAELSFQDIITHLTDPKIHGSGDSDDDGELKILIQCFDCRDFLDCDTIKGFISENHSCKVKLCSGKVRVIDVQDILKGKTTENSGVPKKSNGEVIDIDDSD